MTVERITPDEVWRQMQDPGSEVELVCAYEDEAKCEELRLEGAQTLAELQEREDEVPKDRMLVFYCT